MNELITREEESIKKQAIRNLPTEERYAKGDVEVHGLEDEARKVAYPTARVKPSQDRIKQLRNAGVIDAMEYHSCFRFRVYWAAWKRPLDCKALDYTIERVDGSEWKDFAAERITDADRYLFIANRLYPTASRWLHDVICDEKTLDDMPGRRQLAPIRFRAAIVALDRLLDALHDRETNSQTIYT